MNFQELRHIHAEYNADLTLGVVAVPRSAANSFGIVKVNNQNQIIDFWEKPGDTVLDDDWYIPETLQKKYNLTKDFVFASMSIYLIKLLLLDEILQKKHEMMDFGKEIIPYIIKNQQVKFVVHTGYWEDIGTLDNFHKANLDLTFETNGFDLYDPRWPNLTRPSLLPPTSLKKCDITESIIGEGSRLGKCSIKNCVIGQRAIIGSNSQIENTVIMGADWIETQEDRNENIKQQIPNIGIGNNCTINNAIIDKNSRIGNNVTLLNTKKINNIHNNNYVIRDNIIVIPAKAIIPDNFTL